MKENFKHKVTEFFTYSSKIRENTFSYLKNSLNLDYPIDINRLEIELTTDCNLKCFNCDMSCTQAPNQDFIQLDQLIKFLQECRNSGKKWHEIRLMGGEPTLHKDIVEICHLFLDYKLTFSPQTRINLLTNGYGSRVNATLFNIPEGINIINGMKLSPAQKFYSVNVAPVDLFEFRTKNIKFSRGCKIPGLYGISMTRRGFTACSPGSGIDRVFGFGISITDINSLTEIALRSQLNKLCRYCGYFKQSINSNNHYDLVTSGKISPTWAAAYKKYNSEKAPYETS